MSKFSEFFARLKKIKHIEIIVAVIAVVVMLVIYFSSIAPSKKGETVTREDVDNYCTRMTDEITAAVKNLNGVGKAKVVINWSGSVEYVYAQNGDGSSSPLQVVQTSGSYQPILIRIIYPKAVGVLVVCEGGSNAKIKVDVIMAVSTLLDISTDKVLVFEMN